MQNKCPYFKKWHFKGGDMKKTVSVCLALVVFALFGSAMTVDAQVLAGSKASPPQEGVIQERGSSNFGIVSESVLTVPVMHFMVPNDTVTWSTINIAGTPSVFQTSLASVDWWAPVTLPSGALVTAVELEACDDTATGEILFGMATGVSPGVSGSNVTPVGGTGIAATPGCTFVNVNPTAPLTINNLGNLYWLFIAWSGNFTSSNRVHAVRVFYRLQISPAPAVASFVDVPVGHPFFQVVEALVASGITLGCAPGTYCVNDFVTRGQMAAFLARALGLHFPD